MQIAGGIYIEICESPFWQGIWGSGLRAAMFLSRIDAQLILHGYYGGSLTNLFHRADDIGIKLNIRQRKNDIAFAYFHSLSDPFVEPPIARMEREESFDLEGRSVLRFGFLEGTARVRGERVVYDPQAPREPEQFFANGSVAEELALVLNEQELRAYSKSDDINRGVRTVLESGGANVIVVKQGIWGALVFAREMAPFQVPMYHSAHTFKIGTGDVFSGVFAYYWAEERRDPREAADLASRAVSQYCQAPTSPIDPLKLAAAQPVSNEPPSLIGVYGSSTTLGRRYVLQEALFCIRKLGIHANLVEQLPAGEMKNGTVGLVIADGLSDGHLMQAARSFERTVVLDEERRSLPPETDGICVAEDFTSAIYRICTNRP